MPASEDLNEQPNGSNSGNTGDGSNGDPNGQTGGSSSKPKNHKRR